MTTLDHRLYAWLLEPDERRFENAFNAYYSLAYPALIRRLTRLSRADPSLLEELAQDALLKFFERAGRARREAAKTVENLLGSIKPLELGSLHVTQVSAWTGDVDRFRDDVMHFPVPSAQEESVAWRNVIRTLTERIAPLQRRAWRLIESVRVTLQLQPETDSSSDPSPTSRDIDFQQMAERLAAEVIGNTAKALAAESRLPGAASFIESTFKVGQTLPQLRVPTNGYLFEIALTLYLDACRKRGRLKRGGSGFWPQGAERTEEAHMDCMHPVDKLNLDEEGRYDAEVGAAETQPVRSLSPARLEAANDDPAAQLEGEDYLRRFYEYLRKPLDQALDRLEEAQAKGRATVERRKAGALSEKFATLMSVLSMMGEGHSQTQTAEALGLSRNQVKYMMEGVQESYARFAEYSSGSNVISPSGAAPHVS
jgi:DNA-directed RNA polymerase specialized sigma24 family protein